MSERRCQHGSHRLFALQAYAYATPIWSVPPRWGHGQRYPREGGWIRCSKTHPLLPACFQVTHPKILVCRAFSLSPFRHGRRQCRHHVWATAEGHASSHGPVGMGGFDDADRMHFAGIHAYMPLKAVLRGHRRRAGMNPSASPHSCFQAVGRPVSAAVPVWTACAHGGGAGRRIPIPLLPGGSRSTLAGARSHASMPACSQTRPSLPACFQVTRLKSMVFRSCGLQTPPRFGHVPTIASGRIIAPPRITYRGKPCLCRHTCSCKPILRSHGRRSSPNRQSPRIHCAHTPSGRHCISGTPQGEVAGKGGTKLAIPPDTLCLLSGDTLEIKDSPMPAGILSSMPCKPNAPASASQRTENACIACIREYMDAASCTQSRILRRADRPACRRTETNP